MVIDMEVDKFHRPYERHAEGGALHVFAPLDERELNQRSSLCDPEVIRAATGHKRGAEIEALQLMLDSVDRNVAQEWLNARRHELASK